jgi:hypothetical protein
MKKEQKFLAILLLSVFAVAVIAGVVSAAIPTPAEVRTWADSHIFTASNSYFSGQGFAKVLIFLLVFLIVYAVSEQIPFLNSKGWIAVGFAAVVSALATFFLKSTDVASLLVSYEAMGIAITAIIPFILITVISKGLHEKGHFLLSKFIWIIFIVVTAARFLSAWLAGSIGNGDGIVILVILAASILMFFFGGKIFGSIFKRAMAEKGEWIEEGLTASYMAQRQQKADEIQALGKDFNKNDPTYQRLVAQHDSLVEKLNAHMPVGAPKFKNWQG